MSTTIEKNDVDLSKLFYYGDKFIITDRNDKEILTVYIRLVGDAELNRARVFALRSSATLRKALKDKSSELHQAYIPDSYEEVSKEGLVDLVSSYSLQELAREAMDNTDIPLPSEPKSDASLEEQEAYQAEVDNYPLKRMTIIKEKMDELVATRKKELAEKTKEALIKEYEDKLIATMCEQEMMNKFREMCAYFGTFKDSKFKNKMFSSYESFENILPEIKKQLIENYSSLEMSTEQLKK